MLRYTKILLSVILFVILILPAAGSDEDCFECHSDKGLYKTKKGRRVSLFVNKKSFEKSIHADEGCVSCHFDIDEDDLPHEDDLEKVECETCHDEVVEKYNRSLHGKAKKKGIYLAPYCISCHGKHNILSSSNENSKTFVMNIPDLCGKCHKKGTLVSDLKEVSQKDVLENYSQSIHGDGLFKRGLIVTAVCTSCHRSHEILTHENKASSINKNNITKTCMQCHAQIENVHKKVIRGEHWEKKPHEIPICVDCHQPHEVRRVFYERSFPDTLCMSCHSDRNLSIMRDGKEVSLFVDSDSVAKSIHGKQSCIKCHSNVSNSKEPVCRNIGKVDCSMCHTEEVDQYIKSEHNRLRTEGNMNAPYCTDCHGSHKMKAKSNLGSPTFPRNIPGLCGKCHSKGKPADAEYHGKQHEIVKNYTMSIHGKGLLQSGLMVTATCVDCHTAHRELPSDNPKSTVNKNNIAETCSNCHLGIYEQFKSSVHSPYKTKTDKQLPVCNDCHFSHTIKRVDVDNFRQGIIDQCGKCHEDVTETYFDTFHGKVSKLGSVKTAKCNDCHGAHNILPVSDPKSTLSLQNVVETCKTCHPNSNRKFTGYLTHATHHNKDKYPILFYTFWFMTILLIGTFSFFGLHTLMWIPRAMMERKRLRKLHAENEIAENEISEDEITGNDSKDIAGYENDEGKSSNAENTGDDSEKSNNDGESNEQ